MVTNSEEAPPPEPRSPHTLLVGGGALARAACRLAAGTGAYVAALEDSCDFDPASFLALPASSPGGERSPIDSSDSSGPSVFWVRLWQPARLFAWMKANQSSHLTILGHVARPGRVPSNRDLGRDDVSVAALAGLEGGDDTLLRLVKHLVEQQGITLCAVQRFFPSLLLTRLEALTSCRFSADYRQDIDVGLAVLRALEPYDVGQAVLVQKQRVLAVEGAEGTNGLLRRAAGMAASSGRRPVLVKLKKRTQLAELDLPAFGTETVRLAADQGLAGVVLESQSVLCSDWPETIAFAERLGLPLWAVEPASTKVSGAF